MLGRVLLLLLLTLCPFLAARGDDGWLAADQLISLQPSDRADIASPVSSLGAFDPAPRRPLITSHLDWRHLDSDETSLLTLVQQGEASGGGGGDLASKSQNPISDLVSLPLQNNWDFGVSPGNGSRYIGNLQPVVPVKLNEDWNLINRVIVPFVNVPITPEAQAHGIGDMVGQFYFSPRNSGKLIWGVGPAVMFPTASDPVLGFGQWGAGLNAVALLSDGPIVAGALIYQIWGVEGNTKPFLFQPFFNYNLPEGWFINVSGEANADWELASRNRWSFPLGAGVGRVFPVFGQPMNVMCRFAPYLEKPTGGPDWQFRFNVTLLFPK